MPAAKRYCSTLVHPYYTIACSIDKLAPTPTRLSISSLYGVFHTALPAPPLPTQFSKQTTFARYLLECVGLVLRVVAEKHRSEAGSIHNAEFTDSQLFTRLYIS